MSGRATFSELFHTNTTQKTHRSVHFQADSGVTGCIGRIHAEFPRGVLKPDTEGGVGPSVGIFNLHIEIGERRADLNILRDGDSVLGLVEQRCFIIDVADGDGDVSGAAGLLAQISNENIGKWRVSLFVPGETRPTVLYYSSFCTQTPRQTGPGIMRSILYLLGSHGITSHWYNFTL